ncbi:sensor histidine kinase [Pelagicoccus enzymogenes]|nr:sensor histidine kinase [Pelagicoccus enzymogenes]
MQAAQQLPIRLVGCFISREDNSFAMQDETDGIFVFTQPGFPIDALPGDLIEVIGVTNPGDYAPCASATSIRTIGKTKIPEPIPATIADLHTGQMDVAWVEVTGIVRSVKIGPNPIPQHPREGESPEEVASRNLYTQLKLADGNSHVVVEMQEVLDPSMYLDAKVRLRGHCFYLHNSNRQFVRPILHTPRGIKPEILVQPLHRDFEGTPTSVSSLFTFDHTGGTPGHRVHVRGVVIHQRQGKALWIRDKNQSLRVQTSQDTALQPGDIVDVLGFPELGTYSPLLEDSEFRKRGDGAPPIPVDLEGLNMISWHDSDLVRLEAKLLEVQRYPESVELTLEGLNTTVRASLLTGSDQIELPDWRPNSVVSVTGIATVGEGETIPLNGLWWSESLHISLRSPSDLAIITPAPWWTPKRISYVLAAVLAVALGAIAVVVLLSRNRLREQKQQRALAESEFSAILNERNRVAREIHDTLAQNIGAISVQLEMVRTDAKNLSETTQRHIKTAHSLARTALTDARDSIWNMRSQVLEKYDLEGALKRITTQLTEDSEVEVTTKVLGKQRRLPPVVENNLLRVGQEAITNACKHANATRITVQISYGERRVELVVSDDGDGFNTQQVSPEANRSFGLVGMRERVELLGGKFEITSSKGQGTQILVSVGD